MNNRTVAGWIAFSVLLSLAANLGPRPYELGNVDATISMGHGIYEGILKIPDDFPYTEGGFMIVVRHNGKKADVPAEIKEIGGQKVITFNLGELAQALYGRTNQGTVNKVAFDSEKWKAKPF